MPLFDELWGHLPLAFHHHSAAKYNTKKFRKIGRIILDSNITATGQGPLIKKCLSHQPLFVTKTNKQKKEVFDALSHYTFSFELSSCFCIFLRELHSFSKIPWSKTIISNFTLMISKKKKKKKKRWCAIKYCLNSIPFWMMANSKKQTTSAQINIYRVLPSW